MKDSYWSVKVGLIGEPPTERRQTVGQEILFCLWSRSPQAAEGDFSPYGDALTLPVNPTLKQHYHYCLLIVALSFLFPCASCAAEGETAPAVVPLEPIQLRTINGKRKEIDLPTVLRLALDKNLNIAEAREKVKEERANLSGAKAQFLPNLKFSTGVGRTLGNISTIAQIPSSRATLFINPTRILFESRAVDKLLRASEADLTGATHQTLLIVTGQYYDLLEAQALVRVQEQAVEMAKRLVSDTEALRGQGLAIRADVLTARTELADQEQRLKEAQLNFRVASIALATTLNLDPTITLFPTDKEVRQRTEEIGKLGNREIGELIERALKNRPEIAAATYALAAAQSQKKAAQWGQVIPSFGMEHWFGGFTGNRDTFYFVEWNVLDQLGQLLFSRTRAAKANVRQAELRAEQVRDRVAAQVLAAREKVLTAQERIAAAREAVQQAEETLRTREERLRNNVGILLEVLQAQTALTKARANYVRAIVDYNQAEAELLFALGEINVGMLQTAQARASGSAVCSGAINCATTNH